MTRFCRPPHRAPEGKRPAKPIRSTPTAEEFAAIVANIRTQVFNADAHDSANFVEFIGLAGLGQAEAGALRWGDIDWQKGHLTTFRHKTSKRFTAALFPQLRPMLGRLRGDRGGGPGSDERVFRHQRRQERASGGPQAMKLPAYSHRAFRWMFISKAVEKGIDPKVIASWQDHGDGGRLILSVYSHLQPAHSDSMARLVK